MIELIASFNPSFQDISLKGLKIRRVLNIFSLLYWLPL